MNIQHLRVLAEIARIGSLSGAAAVLATDQPSLSRQLKQIETEFGTPLFHRTGRGVLLTDAGEKLLAISTRYLDEFTELQHEIAHERDNLRGRVSLGVIQFLGSAVVPALLMRFRAAYPDVGLHVVGGNNGLVHELLLNGRIDMGIIYEAGRSQELVGEPVLTLKTCLMGAPALAEAYGLAGLDHVPLSRLAGLPLILQSRHHGLRRMIDHHAMRVGARLELAFEVDNLSTVRPLVRNGAGFCVLPAGALDEEHDTRPCFSAPIVEPEIDSIFSLVFPRNRSLSPLTREFAAATREEIRRYAGQRGRP